MDLTSNTPCPQCGQHSYFRSAEVAALPTYELVGEKEFTISKTKFFPVRPWFCKVCKYVNFTFETPIDE